MGNDLFLYANYYHNLGFNVVRIKGSNLSDQTFKCPEDINWSDFIEKSQDLQYVQTQDWEDSTGIGLVLGYNEYRAIDIDYLYCSQEDRLFKEDREIKVGKFISNCLNILWLPEDYAWVVKSGSGLGIHIIIKVKEIESFSFDTLAYNANSKYRIDDFGTGIASDVFRRMELRWAAHLVLPPTLHKSGGRYEFYNASFPLYQPFEVQLSKLNDLINCYCSDIEYRPCSYSKNNIKYQLNLARLSKTCEEVFSGFWKSKYKVVEDYSQWLEACNSDESLNALGVACVLGINLDQDLNRGIQYFKLAQNNELASFNIANLLSCGVIGGNRSDIQKYLSRCETIPQEYIELVYDNYNKMEEQNGKYYLFFDTETTGIPFDYKAPSSAIDNWPRLVQLSWLLTNEKGMMLSKNNYLIYPSNFEIPKEATFVHSISTKDAKTNGIDIRSVLEQFQKDFNKASYIVGHNISYDKKILGAELIRLGQSDYLDSKESLCTMLAAVDYCKIKGYYGYKYPKLQELYYKLFGRFFTDAHNSESDILATAECFWEMKKKELI